MVHGLLGDGRSGGLGPFVFMMVVFGLILLTLMTYDRPERAAGAPPEDGAPGGDEGTAHRAAEQGGTPENGGPAPSPLTASPRPALRPLGPPTGP